MSTELIEAITMTAEEKKEFRKQDRKVKSGMTASVEAMLALHIIYKKKLYRGSDGTRTFEQYVTECHDIARRHAYRLVDAGEVIAELRNVSHGTHLPENERQIRPLTKVPEGEASAVWQAAVERAETEDVKLTGALVRKVAKEMRPECFEPKKTKKVANTSHSNDQVVDAIEELASRCTDDDFMACSTQAIERLLGAIKQAIARRKDI